MIDARSIAPDRIRPLKRQEYDRLVELGLFARERIELVYGALIQMTPQSTDHTSPIQLLTKLFVRGVGDRAEVRVQMPFVAGDDSEPEPDLALVPPGEYRDAHPSKAFLIVEIAVASVTFDRKVKAPLYASIGVPEYWLVNVPGRVVEVFTRPTPTGYGQVEEKVGDDLLSPAAFPDIRIAVSALVR